MSQKSRREETARSADAAGIDRRGFLSGAVTAAAGLGAAAVAQAQQPSPPIKETNPRDTTAAGPATVQPAVGGGVAPTSGPKLFRLESEIADCEVEGKIPADLQGAFYRVGPDAQYPMDPRNIPFDGEGHVSMFHFKDGRVSYRTRFVRNERYVAQEAAHRILFPMYRNPMADDPSVQGKTRGTANTHIIVHNKKLFALKEDSPPVEMNPLTLETVDPVHTFNGQLESKTFTAHPKLDSETGNMIAFGYEAKGFGTDDVNVFEYTPDHKRVWNAWIKVPYIGMIHDFAVTQKHVIFYVIPLAFDIDQMKRGGIHWSWDGTKPTWFGVMRRGGDGKDLRWFKGPERSATHVMGCYDDGNKVYVDVEMSLFNPFPFMPFRDGQTWNPVKGSSRITRLSVDTSKKSVKDYNMEVMYPNHLGALPRQDDRYNTAPYRVGFLPCQLVEDPAKRPSSCYARFDIEKRTASVYRAADGMTLAEACFAPKNAKAPEGVGYLMGVASHVREGGRADLLIFDAEHLEAGPIATVKMPTRIVGQIHGWWAPAEHLPA